jgi:hypothetical protein
MCARSLKTSHLTNAAGFICADEILSSRFVISQKYFVYYNSGCASMILNWFFHKNCKNRFEVCGVASKIKIGLKMPLFFISFYYAIPG